MAPGGEYSWPCPGEYDGPRQNAANLVYSDLVKLVFNDVAWATFDGHLKQKRLKLDKTAFDACPSTGLPTLTPTVWGRGVFAKGVLKMYN